jgi:4-diphosphocytidyl-2-C-methyl-D-erythritol kinase
MSGSGASCFGLFETGPQAIAAAKRIGAARPGWWVAAAPGEGWKG